jgi:hypothetical protein
LRTYIDKEKQLIDIETENLNKLQIKEQEELKLKNERNRLQDLENKLNEEEKKISLELENAKRELLM